jgi:hypothetical protein
MTPHARRTRLYERLIVRIHIDSTAVEQAILVILLVHEF